MNAAVSIEEAARLLGVSAPTIRRLLKQKRLGCMRVAKRITIPMAEIERFQARQFEPAVDR